MLYKDKQQVYGFVLEELFGFFPAATRQLVELRKTNTPEVAAEASGRLLASKITEQMSHSTAPLVDDMLAETIVHLWRKTVAPLNMEGQEK